MFVYVFQDFAAKKKHISLLWRIFKSAHELVSSPAEKESKLATQILKGYTFRPVEMLWLNLDHVRSVPRDPPRCQELHCFGFRPKHRHNYKMLFQSLSFLVLLSSTLACIPSFSGHETNQRVRAEQYNKLITCNYIVGLSVCRMSKKQLQMELDRKDIQFLVLIWLHFVYCRVNKGAAVKRTVVQEEAVGTVGHARVGALIKVEASPACGALVATATDARLAQCGALFAALPIIAEKAAGTLRHAHPGRDFNKETERRTEDRKEGDREKEREYTAQYKNIKYV